MLLFPVPHLYEVCLNKESSSLCTLVKKLKCHVGLYIQIRFEHYVDIIMSLIRLLMWNRVIPAIID